VIAESARRPLPAMPAPGPSPGPTVRWLRQSVCIRPDVFSSACGRPGRLPAGWCVAPASSDVPSRHDGSTGVRRAAPLGGPTHAGPGAGAARWRWSSSGTSVTGLRDPTLRRRSRFADCHSLGSGMPDQISPSGPRRSSGPSSVDDLQRVAGSALRASPHSTIGGSAPSLVEPPFDVDASTTATAEQQ
jgi:hypothetical protein